MCKKIFISISTVAVLCSCTSSSNPLSTFEPIAKACATALASPRADHISENAQQGDWTKIVYNPNVVKYDVRKTESLASPYIAEINVAYDDIVFIRDTRAQVESAKSATTPMDHSTSTVYRFIFTYQSNHWKLQRIESTFQTSLVKDVLNSPVDISREELAKRFPESLACLASPVV